MSGYIRIEYLYRDADNYKRYGIKLFGNPSEIHPERVRQAFALAFQKSQFFPDVLSFDPALLGWEPLFFDGHDTEAGDISLHEIGQIESMQELIHADGNVDELLRRLVSLSELED